jgi:fatty acid/phospholipid biosynthesis enzyme
VVAHGRSDARAIRNAVRVAIQAVDGGLVGKIREAVGR